MGMCFGYESHTNSQNLDLVGFMGMGIALCKKPIITGYMGIGMRLIPKKHIFLSHLDTKNPS